jgi:O-antigen biosynthesis protein
MFQCLYQPSPAHWAMLPGTLEWHGLAALVAIAALAVWYPLGGLTAVMIALSLAVAGLQALQARLPRQHRHWRARLVIAILCYLQPLVRSWARYRVRFIWHELPKPDPAIAAAPRRRRPWVATRTAAYWSDTGQGRIELLKKALDYMNEYRIGKLIDSGWFDWDIGVYCQAGIILKVATVQEDHGGGRRLVRIRYRLAISPWLPLSVLASLSFVMAVGSPWAVVAALGLLGLGGRLWWRASQTALRVVGLFDVLAGELGMVPCPAADP